MVIEEAHDLVDNQARMTMTVNALNFWLVDAIALCLAALIPCALAFIILLLQQTSMSSSPAQSMLSLVYIINACPLFGYAFRFYADSQNVMVSTQRIIEYGNLKREDEDVNESEEQQSLSSTDTDNTTTVPALPHISFLSFSCRYRAHLPLVLRSISFSISCGEKIGIVGRTGAGKSTLFLCLCRMMDSQQQSGDILISGNSIFRMPLHSLRRMFCVVPQQPVLFGGETLRFNIDPFGVQGKEEIEEGMRMVGLEGQRRFAGGAGMAMRIESGNVSDGEAQLICICRVVLMARRKENAILLVDEATANIDDDTDRIIQEVVREEFKRNTVLTIAHRVQTVMDSDRILVISGGEVGGFDTARY